MSILKVNRYGYDEFIEAYQKDGKWYESSNNEIIKREFIYERKD